MRSFIFALSSLLILIASGSLNAREFVVSQKSDSASDENSGTAQKPLKTISAAVARVHAGDRVIVHGGNYREVVIITASGTAQAPIVIEAATGETPVIKGSDVINGWQHDDGSVWKAALRRYPPRGNSSEKPVFYDTNDVRQVFTHDGSLLDAHRLRRVTERKAMKEDSFFRDPKQSLLYVWLPASASPIDQPPEVSVRAGWLNLAGSHIVVRGIQMRHASTTSVSNAPACSLQSEDNTLENCVISWGDFLGVSMSGTGHHLLNCLIACNGDSGIGGTGEHHTIEGCRVVYNNVDRYNPEWHAGGAKLIPNFSHGSIRHNEFAHNFGPGLWLDGGCNENVVDGNVTHDNEGPGIMVEVSKGNVVLNNICYANRNNLSGPYRDEKGIVTESDLSALRISPSRLLKIYHSGEGRGIYISSAPNTKVLYNTVYLNEAEGICVEGPPRPDGTITWETRNETVANNIIAFNNGSQLTLREAKGEQEKIYSDNNVIFSVGAVFAKYGWEGPAAFSIPDWQKTSGGDAHSIDADPRFALAAMADFRILPTSAALGAGQAAPEADHDFFGQQRDPEKPTIGACEKPAENYPQAVWQSLSETIRSAHR